MSDQSNGQADLGHAVRRRPAVRIAWLVVALAGLLALGIIQFANSLARHPPRDIAAADGIVVLTGGADRINDGITLLEQGKGRRLMISGVNAQSTPEKLKRYWPGRRPLFECCIDLDYRAQNTVQNAQEGRAWVEAHGFRSLIVVTASYHLPRAMIEFAQIMPGVDLQGFPVIPEASKLRRWWQEPALVRIIALEFVKYWAVSLRASLNLPAG